MGCCEMDCDRLSGMRYRNEFVAVISGILFFTGWWILIYALAATSSEQFPRVHIICGFVASLGFVIVNLISNDNVRSDLYRGGALGTGGFRLFLFLGFLCVFSSLIASIWILFGFYVNNPKSSALPGICIFLQNLFIIISAFTFKFGRSDDAYDP